MELPNLPAQWRTSEARQRDVVEFSTLPDYLEEGLDIVFVGLNPSERSVSAGHYFANPRNRF
tara:strand:- start:351 stop:536 length:186 start_codon:yes stop_codon:yes gene_type:complete